MFHLLAQITVHSILVIVPIILSVSYLTYIERRVIGFIQLRQGPNTVGPFGLLQPIADSIKLINKEIIIPSNADRILFLSAPVMVLILSLASWAVIPIASHLQFASIKVALLYLLSVSSLNVCAIIVAGWASNSKYALMGAMRSAAQIISYEIVIGLTILTIVVLSGSLELCDIVEISSERSALMRIFLMPLGVIFFISSIAETNRHPFDLPEAETELVAGYNVEYSSTGFAMFFLGEYAHMITTSTITALLFLGGYLPILSCNCLSWVPGGVWLMLKASFLLFCFMWVRATLPRYKYDQLLAIGWKKFIPIALFYFVACSLIVRFG